MKSSLQAWLHQYYTEDFKNFRLGEKFVVDFVSHDWLELRQEEDNEKALKMAVAWLLECRVYPLLPHKIERK